MRTPELVLRVLALAGLLAVAARTHAASPVDGLPDSAFNGNGRAVVDVGPDARLRAVAAQADGKLVAVGHATFARADDPSNTAFVVVRWNRDGSRDTTFGANHTGLVVIEFDLGPVGWRFDGATSVALQPDGKVVVAGYARTSSSEMVAAVARLTATGGLDPSFGGGDGKVALTELGFSSRCSVLLRRNGAILLTPKLIFGDNVVVQLTGAGDLYPNFGFGGQSEPWSCGSVGCGGFLDTVELPDGRLLTLATAASRSEVALVAFLGEAGGPGEIDVGFGNRGLASFTPSGFSQLDVMGMALDHNGRVVVMARESSAPWHTALLRVRGDQLDPTFGAGGWSAFTFQPPASATTAAPSAMALQPDGKLLIAGTGLVDGSWNFVVTRRTADGNAVDPRFSGGWSTLAFDVGGGLTDEATVITLSAGRIVVGGEVQTSSSWLFGLGRLGNSLLWTDGFESGSTWFWQARP